jgi:hypothetical protein
VGKEFVRASEFITENRPANYPGGFSKNRAGKYTFNLDRRKLNVPELIKRGAIFVTYPHGDNGWETDAKLDWQRSILTLYNVLFDGGWTSEAKKYLKPQSYKKAEQDINSSAPNLGSDESVYDGKYNQILWSIKKLGIPDSVAFLDTPGVAEGKINEIYKIPPTTIVGPGLAIRGYNDALEKKYPILYKDTNVIIFKTQWDDRDYLSYIELQDGNPALYLGLSKFLDGYRSETVATEIAGRGKGLAQKAYLNASDILGVPIYSDMTQTDASRLGIWDKLIQQYPDRIVGYDQKTNKNLPLSMTDKGPVVNQNQPVYVDKKNSNRQATPTQRYRTRLLKLLPKKQGVAEGASL